MRWLSMAVRWSMLTMARDGNFVAIKRKLERFDVKNNKILLNEVSTAIPNIARGFCRRRDIAAVEYLVRKRGLDPNNKYVPEPR
jgi:hypothetical protein